MAHGGHETEIKLPSSGAAHARRLLRAAGFRLFKRRVFEANSVFDKPDFSFRDSGRLLRVREARGAATLTYKGPPEPGRHKSREELEFELPHSGALRTILERLGLHVVFRYEKYRAEYKQAAGGGVATLDETPIGVFLELEGPPAWIDRTARKLGFAESDYITHSYARLYLDWCREHAIEPSDMVFPEARGARTRSAQRTGE